MNVEKHECSLLSVFSDVGSTPTASTTYQNQQNGLFNEAVFAF
jgi:hypothetical protein